MAIAVPEARVRAPHYRAQRFQGIAKRTFDVLLSGLLLLSVLPILLITALLLVIDSPGPIFFRSERVGYRGRPLWMLKLRKMHTDADGPGLTMADDERFTRLGVWLARLKLDEIPQLWHVFRGDMSLVGPRPESPSYVDLHRDDYQRIVSVRPGMTGLSQLAYMEEGRILDKDRPHEHYVDRILPQKLVLDQLYASRWSVAFDLRILFWTIAAVVLRRPVAVNRNNAAMGIRRR